MKITSIFSYIPYKKYLAGVLVFTILVSQTIHVDFFEEAGASPENYRDIVSIVVDKGTYGSERTRILRYASDIAGYLGGVRTSILVVDSQTPVATIAAKQEKLYYEGDGEGDVSSLVGTVLIGNIPLPKVVKNGTTFSSLYPYVDFADKTFVYNDKNSQYIYNTESKSESVEIWHGIINPATGRNWEGASDISKIGQFLDKTHQFYTKSGKFAPSTLPPKVLYYDGQSESKSTDARAVFQYELSMKNSENLAYNRFTKYLLGDISSALRVFDAKNADADIASIYASLGLPQGSDTLSDEQIKKLPDVQSREVILGFLKNFKQIFNEKTLGDELLAVHNAGRYTSGSTVSADLLPVTISLMDEVARSTLKASNDGISELINASLSGGIASKIVIFDKNIPAFSGGINGIDDALEQYKKEYKNYYFGQLSENILSPEQCTIARGSSGDVSQFGRSVLVEANSAFDISSTQAHIDLLTKDTATMTALHKNANFACFNASLPKLISYWGDNSILKTTAELSSGTSPDSFLFEPSPASNFRGFSLPIASLGGMKETSSLTIPSIANCINNDYQYTLLQPYVVTYNDEFRFGSRNHRVAWPTEWNVKGKYNGAGVPTFTCNTVHEVGAPIAFGKSAEEYTTRSCFAGNLSVDGKIVKTATNTCISSIAGPRGAIDRDNTVYEDRYYHTIPSIWSHVSPTQSEIDAAKVSGVTPSLAIDHIRYVEFLTPKGNVARIDYPNFFNVEGNDIASVRNWLKNISNNQWKAIIDKENSTSISSERAAINAIVPPGSLPASPIDWNTYVSDASIEKIIQSRNWLQPDISTKYRRAIESMLSYSHENASVTPTTSGAPKIPSLSHEYEIAYLGLPSSFEPDFSQDGAESSSEYDAGIREIEGANISEESLGETTTSSSPSSKCGPPDGVPILQWPSAIMCWIESQFPPRILAGSCSPSTIGMDSPFSGISTSPSSAIIQNSTALSAFYNGAQIVPHVPRSSMQLQDSITVDLHLQKRTNYLTSLPDTTAHLEIKNIVVGGKNIAPSSYDDFLIMSPSSVMVGEKGASFILESQGKIARAELQGYYIVPLPDGKELRINSESLSINITPEYYNINLAQSGVLMSQIDVTSPDVVTITTQKILQNGSAVSPSTELSFNIFDDVDGSLVSTGVLSASRTTLPVDITKKIGVYRLIVSDRTGVTGEMTFSVVAGKISQVRIVPVSSALVRGSSTVAMIRLQDRLGNPIAADIHTLNLEISGGYFQDSTGAKKTSMTMDVMEGQVPIMVGSTSPGKIKIQATVSDADISTNQEIVVYNGARVTLIRDRNPRVGDTSVPVRIEIQDESGRRLPGFSSVVSWKLPDGAGSFSKEAITIVDGVSEKFEYIPGTVAGNHALTLDVPGVGSISNIVFSLLPGDPLYVSHVEDTNTLIFTLRDRYNNIVSDTSLPGKLSYNNTTPRDIAFVQGKYSIPLQGGQYTITVAELKNSKIIYFDDSGNHTISGIDTYSTYIAQSNQKLDFAPDYNARYTVLAGNAFLREGEDILYNTLPGQSQSLAVTTLLESPRAEDAIFSIHPGGAYRINGNIYDMSITTSISLSGNYPLLSVSDIVRKKQIAQVLYTMKDATLESCQFSTTEDCLSSRTSPTIRVISSSGSQFFTVRNSDYIQLNSSLANILSIKKDGSIIASPQVQLVPKDTSVNGLEMSVMLDDAEIARVIYFTDMSLSVARTDSLEATKNTPTLISSNFSIHPFSSDTLSSSKIGYKITQSVTSSDDTIDETKNGPMHIDSLGSLSDISSIGWKGNNTMLLAYAAGDSVGESTRFFHTYTLVNLGDPVAHVDHGRVGTEIDGIDRTIGSIITRSNGNGIANFFHRDMNADGLSDLVVLYQDGYMELFLNHKGKFRSRGMISYNRDIDNKNVFFADFLADGFGDIIGLNTEGDLILVDNSNRKFSRPTITIADGAILPRHISQMKVYDMDQDKRDDIVYITASGELGVLYGTSTVGLFTKKVLDPTLGITLSPDPISTGGAIKSNTTPQISGDLSVDTTIDTSSLDDSMLEAEVYYQYRHVTPLAEGVLTTESLSGSFDAIAQGEQGSRQDTFVRSQYAVPYGLQIQKTYINKTHTTLYADDLIQARIIIKNTTSSTIRNIEYLDTIPGIFSLEQTQKYTVTTNNTTIERPIESLSSDEYDAYFVGRDLLPGQSLEIIYDLVALPASYGEMIVGDLEKGTVGVDIYGDVGFKTSTTCGASMLLWASGPGSRDYTRGTHEFGAATLPEPLATRLADADNNSIPDSVENMSLADRQKAYTDISRSQNSNPSFFKKSLTSGQINLDLDPKATDTIIDATQNLLDGLSCGFGGGGCLNSPLNWAPLAPGSSPTLFGMPLNIKGMTPSSGMPVFSALTGMPMVCGTVPCCIPTVYPMSPLGFVPGPTCGAPSAGGNLGTWAPSNFLRVYVTPTLTLGMGTAVCLGGPAIAAGQIPPQGLSPLIKGGNCIVVAKSLPVCKGDGSIADGDVSAISGLGTLSDTWNSSSCTPTANTLTETENVSLTNDIIGYLKSPDTTRLNNIYGRMATRGARSIGGTPLLQIGGPSSGGGTIDIDIDSNTRLPNSDGVIKTKNKRVAAFPDFLMDWLTRQTEEMTTSLFTPPNLTIIPPTDLGQNAQVDGSYKDFSEKLGNAYSEESLKNIQQASGDSYDTTANSKATQKPLGQAKPTLNSVKTAYTMVGKLPFISVKQKTIPLNIPWVNKRELSKYGNQLNAYKNEFNEAMKRLCATDPSPECAEKKAKLQSGAFIGSVLANLKAIDGYERFPLKIQKYITWKERYIAELLCNVNSIQQITGGWLRDNGVRFRKWAELFVLIRAIAESWQPILDIFAGTSKSCGVCRNERYNLQYWKFKLLSMLIPSLPVIKFPKFPDLVLDLSDVRMGISFTMPNFDPRISPVRLPNLPQLSLGDLSAGLSLPGLPLLPRLPDLPDLPDLPSLPRINLPDLPPPPKLPKIAGSIEAFLKIMKLISTMYCFYQKTFLIPEWQAGDIIAQRTERQGTLPFDFINLSLPQFSLPSVREIRVGSHVDYNLRSDFISEFAKKVVEPVNQFKTDLQTIVPKKIMEDVGIEGNHVNLNQKLNFMIEEDPELAVLQKILADFTSEMEADANTFLEVEDFKKYILTQLTKPEFTQSRLALVGELESARLEAKKTENELVVFNNKKFDLLKEYISSETDDIAKLQNIVDLLQKDHETDPRLLISETESRDTRSTELLKKFETFQSATSYISPSSNIDSGLDSARTALSARIGRMTADAASSLAASAASSSSVADGYSPRYQGVYVRTPSGVQTQLFDYIDPLSDDTRIDTVDIDQDGDLDYMYVLDDSLYVKYNWTKIPNKIQDMTVTVNTISPNDALPYVPDYFHENISVPKNLNFSFVPSLLNETAWRAEFYDRYIEWDNVDIGSHDPAITPKTTIDMFLETSPSNIAGTTLKSIAVQRSITSVRDPASFVLEGRNIQIYTGALSISVSPGRTLYTGSKKVVITYKNKSYPTGQIFTFDPYTGYQFNEVSEVTTDNGKLYLIGPEDGSRTLYQDDLIGLPILPGMHIYASDRGAILHDHISNNDIVLGAGAQYMSYNLGAKKPRYEVSFSYPNGYYYARLQNLTLGKMERAGVILFAPQMSSDTGAPVVDLPSRIRLPIYSTKTYKISDILTDLSNAELSIDSNLSIDSDGNGSTQDDFTKVGTGFSISNTSITFGSFATPGKYSMNLRALDEMGNTIVMPLSLEAYVLMPQIQSVTSTGNILGSIPESIEDTPIHFFRVRPGEIPTIVTPNAAPTNTGGLFATGSFFKNIENIGLINGANPVRVDSHGVFMLPSGYKIDILPATIKNPMQLLTMNASGSISHIHTLTLPDDTVFIDGSKATKSQTGVIINSVGGQSQMVSATMQDVSIPGGVYITDIDYKPLVGVARDGNIYVLDPTVTLRYNIRDGYMMIEVIRDAKVMSTLEYRIDFFYTKK